MRLFAELLPPLLSLIDKGLNFDSGLFYLPYLCSVNQQTKQYERRNKAIF